MSANGKQRENGVIGDGYAEKTNCGIKERYRASRLRASYRKPPTVSTTPCRVPYIIIMSMRV